MGTAIAIFFSHAVRIALVAGVMLLIGTLVGKVLGWFGSLVGIQSGAAILSGFLLVAITGIAGGTYVSVRHIASNSVWHPVAAGALLGLFPAGLTFQGDAGLMRFAILLGAIAIAAIATLVTRYRTSRPGNSLVDTRRG